VLLASSFDEMPLRHPRFVAWRALWSHALEAWSPADSTGLALPTLLIDDGPISVELIDAVHWRGRVESDPRTAQIWRDTVDAVLQRSEPAFAVNRLGL